MLTFLFWNVGGKALSPVIAKLADLHGVDILVLAESDEKPSDLLQELNRNNPTADRTGFRGPDLRSQSSRVIIYPRFPTRFLLLRSESDKYSCRLLRLPGRPEILLVAAHFASKRYRSDDSQSLAVPGFSTLVRLVEKQAGHSRTILVGDLNMNPYELGIVGAEGLNAVITREVASRQSRRIDGVDHPFFYNPMWSQFGDSTHHLHPPGSPEHEPPGTCYYPSAESRWYFWNMFDQVLLRPELLQYFTSENLKILVTDGTTSFLDRRGLPDRKVVSDHLPVLCRLDV
jgi:endonuclease/exonuclease/phosphatase family metal-dependent hydrolase